MAKPKPNKDESTTPNAEPTTDLAMTFPETPPMDNQPPMIHPMSDLETHPGVIVNFVVTATDPEGDDLTFELVGGPSGAALDEVTGEFTWEPDWGDLGAHIVTVKVSDATGDNDQDSCTISVSNAAPHIAPLPDVVTHPGHTVSIIVQAFDPDGDAITYSLVQGPPGASLDPTTGEFRWTPGWGDLGARYVTIKVTDPGGESDQDSFIISVENQPPNLAPLSDQLTMPGQTVNFVAMGTDPDGDNLTYALVQGPAGATLDSSSGVFNWLPGESDVGAHIVTIKVLDPGNASDQDTCVITVETIGPGPLP